MKSSTAADDLKQLQLLSTDGANTVVAPGLPEVIPGRPQPGRYSAEAIAQGREVAALLRTCRDQLATMCD
jgi:hypothetical protein